MTSLQLAPLALVSGARTILSMFPVSPPLGVTQFLTSIVPVSPPLGVDQFLTLTRSGNIPLSNLLGLTLPRVVSPLSTSLTRHCIETEDLSDHICLTIIVIVLTDIIFILVSKPLLTSPSKVT